MAAYCASKAALDHFARCLMLEVRQQGVKVTTLAPGSVDTGFGRAPGPRAGRGSWMLTPEDMAAGRAGPAAHARRRAPEPRRDAPAASPHEGVIRPLRATLRVAWRAFLRFQDHHGPDRAAAVAYYTLLSLVPLLIFLISLGMAVLGSFDAAFQGSMLLVRGVVIHSRPAARSRRCARSWTQASRFQLAGPAAPGLDRRGASSPRCSRRWRPVFGVPGRSFAKHNLVALSMVLVAGMALLFTMAFTMLVRHSEGLMLRLRASGELQSLQLAALARGAAWPITFAFFFVVYRFVPRKAHERPPRGDRAPSWPPTLWETRQGGFRLLHPQRRPVLGHLRHAGGHHRPGALAGDLGLDRPLLRRGGRAAHPPGGRGPDGQGSRAGPFAGARERRRCRGGALTLSGGMVGWPVFLSKT